jgi:hypothetical protein
LALRAALPLPLPLPPLRGWPERPSCERAPRGARAPSWRAARAWPGSTAPPASAGAPSPAGASTPGASPSLPPLPLPPARRRAIKLRGPRRKPRRARPSAPASSPGAAAPWPSALALVASPTVPCGASSAWEIVQILRDACGSAESAIRDSIAWVRFKTTSESSGAHVKAGAVNVVQISSREGSVRQLGAIFRMRPCRCRAPGFHRAMRRRRPPR